MQKGGPQQARRPNRGRRPRRGRCSPPSGKAGMRRPHGRSEYIDRTLISLRTGITYRLWWAGKD
eukprot:502076-Prymnesium_polylepis.1